MTDRYANFGADLSAPYVGGFAVAPSDTVDFDQPTRAVWVGGAGDLAVSYVDGSSDTLKSVPAGTLLPVRATKVLETGTTATDISGLY